MAGCCWTTAAPPPLPCQPYFAMAAWHVPRFINLAVPSLYTSAQAELTVAQRELASAEEQLQAAQQHLREDAADLEADSRDLVVLRRQLFATRAALLEARQRLEEQQARLAEPGAGRVCPACPTPEGGDAGAGGCAAALLDLQECRDEVERLQEAAPPAVAAVRLAGAATALPVPRSRRCWRRHGCASLSWQRSAPTWLPGGLMRVLSTPGGAGGGPTDGSC